MKTHVLGTFALAGLAFSLPTPMSAQVAQSFCEIGFVLADQNEDGVLDTAEVEALRAAEFGALDQNADGTVTTDEITACSTIAGDREVLPRNVGAEAGDMPPVEFPALEDGTLTREEYMEAAELAFDATRNEEENPIQWARNFIFLTGDEGESDIASMSRQEFAARSAAMFHRLDADGNGELSTEEWQAETPPGSTAASEAGLTRADADQSGGVSLEEYVAAGNAQAERGRLSAMARGWDGEEDTQAGGVETGDEADAEGESAVEAGGDVPVFDYYFDRGE